MIYPSIVEELGREVVAHLRATGETPTKVKLRRDLLSVLRQEVRAKPSQALSHVAGLKVSSDSYPEEGCCLYKIW